MKKIRHKRSSKKRKLLMRRIGISGIVALLLFFIVFFSIFMWEKFHGTEFFLFDKGHTKKVEAPKIEEAFLTPNEYSRPQIALKKVKGIVVHYTANPNSDAMDNRDYFENLKDTHTTSVSSHFVIGLDGTIVQCIPLDEIAYASNERNVDTISIECCHKKKNGEFTDATYQSLLILTAWLCGEYDLKEDDIIRHYDITGKQCPKYYVEHEDLWIKFKKEVFDYISTYGYE